VSKIRSGVSNLVSKLVKNRNQLIPIPLLLIPIQKQSHVISEYNELDSSNKIYKTSKGKIVRFE